MKRKERKEPQQWHPVENASTLKQTEEEYWKEDAERLNALADAAKKKGIVVQTRDDTPPELNEDGSLKDG